MGDTASDSLRLLLKELSAKVRRTKQLQRQLDDLEPAITSLATQSVAQREKAVQSEGRFLSLQQSGYYRTKSR